MVKCIVGIARVFSRYVVTMVRHEEHTYTYAYTACLISVILPNNLIFIARYHGDLNKTLYSPCLVLRSAETASYIVVGQLAFARWRYTL